MGEIGIPRHEFLYELKFWELRSIIRGYNARHHAGWEQARLIAYHSAFAMGSKNPVPEIRQWMKFPWEKAEAIPQEDIDDIQGEIDAILKNSKQ